MPSDMPTLDTQIRKLRSDQLAEIAKILNQDDCWKKLMAVVPNNDNSNQNKPLFKPEHISMIEQSTQIEQRIAAEVFLTEWSTMGKRRPTCKTLLDLLVKTKLFRAADYLAVEVLKIDSPERPKIGPAAPIDVSDALVEALLKQQIHNALKNAESNVPERALSMRFQEKPTSVPVNAGDENELDLIQFSKSTNKILEEKPEDISDLIKFSSTDPDTDVRTEDFVLPEALSQNIPLCVKQDMFESTGTISSANDNLTTDRTASSHSLRTAEDRSLDTVEEFDLPQISERLIPMAVLQYSDYKSES